MAKKSSVSAGDLTKTYIKIREEKARLSAKFKEEEAVLTRQLDRVKQGLLDYCDAHNVESVRTSEGLFFRATKRKYWTADCEKMYAFVLKHEVPELFERRLNQTNLKQFLEENPEVQPEGLNVDTTYSITVRKK